MTDGAHYLAPTRRQFFRKEKRIISCHENVFNITSIYIHAALSLEEKKARSHNGVNTENRDIHLVIFVLSIMQSRGLPLGVAMNVCLFLGTKLSFHAAVSTQK